MSQPRTLSQKIWDRHVVTPGVGGAPDLLYIDLHLIHEVTSPQAFDGLRMNGRPVRRPDLTVATEDHNTPTEDQDKPIADEISATQIETLRTNTKEFGIVHYPMGHENNGIVHVMGPEQGLTQPGMTIVCGDSHTATHGVRIDAFGIGTSEVEHVLATQTLPQARPGTMAITVNGDLRPGVTPKDVILHVIGVIGTGGGIGKIIEYRGDVFENMSMEGRMTVCNMSIEGGAKAGLIAPDETTFEYVAGRPNSPVGAELEAAIEDWKTLATDDGAVFDEEVIIDAADIAPQVSWGTNPAQVMPIDGVIPGPTTSTIRIRQHCGSSPRVHGFRGRHPDQGHQGRHRLHRQLHEQPDRGSASGGRRRQGAQGRRRHAHPCRTGLRPGQAAGRSRGPAGDLPRSRL